MRHYDELAKLFTYPDSNFSDHLGMIFKLIDTGYQNALPAFFDFQHHVTNMDPFELEEYFVRTFEVEAICCMDLGYVLFGEDYKRGDFLAKMQHEQTLCGNDTGTELADHLPNVLTLLPRLSAELSAELGYILVLPAIREIFHQLKSKKNLYQHAFALLIAVMESDFHDLPCEQYVIRYDIGASVPEEYAAGCSFFQENKNLHNSKV